jgi:hypothetical protein
MGLSVADFRELVRARLREAGNSKLGQLQSGTNDPPIVTADERIDELGLRIAEEMCKTCFAYRIRGVVASLPSAEWSLDLSTLNTGGRATIWRPLFVAWNGFPLRESASGNLPLGWETLEPEARIRYWSYIRDGQIAFSPTPSVSLPLVVDGAATPLAPSGGTPTWDWAPDSVLYGPFVAGSAALLTAQNTDNDALAARGALWQAEYDAERFRLWSLVDDGVRKKLFPNPPAVVEAKGMVRGR